MLRIYFLGWLLLLAWPTAWAEVPLPAKARVFKVFDGDYLMLRSRYHSHRVQLAGIDAPELAQPWGRRSQQVLEKMVRGQLVGLRTVGTNDRGEPLVQMRLRNFDINIEMVAAGAAWALPGAAPELQAAEGAARRAGKGLWAPGEQPPVPPWQWRTQH